MSGKPTIKSRDHEGLTLDQMKAKEREEFGSSTSKGVDKHATLVKGPDDGPETAAPRHPNDEELEKINRLTLTPKTADQLFVFDTLSMNDLPDRDDDFFTTDAVKGFAALPQPFSPVGKSYMVDHAYKVDNARGRIFDAGVKQVELEGGGTANFLTNSIYVPNTPQYANFIENLDFGIQWAVSVGVTIGKSFCSVCDAPFSRWGYWCSEGHDKGYHYLPDSDEVDQFGWPMPVPSDTPGAVKCLRGFDDPLDFYELSQVFLGAQYFAALDRESKQVADFEVASKTAGFLSVPESFAKKLPLPREPQKVRDARKSFEVKTDDEGNLIWTDADGLGWIFDPMNEEQGVLCTGRSVDDDGDVDDVDTDKEVNDTDDSAQGSDESRSAGESGGDEESQPDEGADTGSESAEDGEGSNGEDASSVSDSADESSDSPAEVGDEGGEIADGGSSNESTSGASEDTIVRNLAALIPDAFFEGKSASEASAKEMTKAIEKMVKLAECGEHYVRELRSDALAWFVRSNTVPERQGVKTDAFEKMLHRIGDDVELLKEVVQEQKDLAQSRFPSTVRRSSFPSNTNEPTGPAPLQDREEADFGHSDTKVSRLHSTGRD